MPTRAIAGMTLAPMGKRIAAAMSNGASEPPAPVMVSNIGSKAMVEVKNSMARRTQHRLTMALATVGGIVVRRPVLDWFVRTMPECASKELAIEISARATLLSAYDTAQCGRHSFFTATQDVPDTACR